MSREHILLGAFPVFVSQTRKFGESLPAAFLTENYGQLHSATGTLLGAGGIITGSALDDSLVIPDSVYIQWRRSGRK